MWPLVDLGLLVMCTHNEFCWLMLIHPCLVQVNDMVREEEGSMAAEDVVHPLRALAQQAYSQDMTSHAANQAGHAEQQRSVAQAAACAAS